MKIKTFFALLLVFTVLCTALPLYAAADEDTVTVKFTDGLNLINPLTGKAPTKIFTGTAVPPMTVKKGDSIVLPENTLIFREYVFDGWKYTYTDADGKKHTELYQPGDTFENVTENIKFDAAWKRPDPIDLVIVGYLRFVSTESYVDGEVPETMQVVYNSTIRLKKTAMTKDGYKFCGWVDSDGNFYENGGEYTVNKLNPVLTAIWETDGTAVLTHKVVYKKGADDTKGELPRTQEMYKKDKFTAAECTLKRDGWRFVCWTDDSGKEYIPGKEYKAEGDVLNLTAKWEKVINYYTVTVNHNDGGTVAPDSPIKVEEHGNVQITVTPDNGYSVSSVTVNGQAQSLENGVLSLKDVTGDITVAVTFEKKALPSIAITSSGEGEIKDVPAPDGKYAFSVHPAEGFKLGEITVSGAEYTLSDGVYLLDNLSGESIRIHAVFVPIAASAESGSAESNAASGTAEPVQTKSADTFYLILLGVLVVGLVAFTVVYAKRKH